MTEIIRAGDGPAFEITSQTANLLSPPSTGKGRLQRAALALLLEHDEAGEIPTNGRFVFYELEGRGVVSKVRTGARRADQDLTEALMRLRERGIVPWSWINDETRECTEWSYAPSVAEYVADRINEARINPWPGEPPLLIVESRSLGGVVRRLAYQYVVPFAPTNGQVGGFLYTEVAPLLIGNERPVLYLGDLDLQGSQIEANTRNVLERETGREIEWERIAITQAQVDAHGLEPISKTDNRYRPARQHWAVETEALGQTTVTTLVRDALDARLPVPLSIVREREQHERATVADALLHHDTGTADPEGRST